MARLQRIAPLGIPQHIIQRGNDRQACFACDYHFFRGSIGRGDVRFQILFSIWDAFKDAAITIPYPQREYTCMQ